jgi:hypothetical protein
MRNACGGCTFRVEQAVVSSPATIEAPSVRVWRASYPPKGSAEARATVTEDDGGFGVWVRAVGWARKRHGQPERECRAATLEEARERADALAAEVLGRDVAARWHTPVGDGE